MDQKPEPTSPGIVVLSASLQLLHMNRRARDMLTQLEGTSPSAGTKRALATPLHRHCQDILETMQDRMASNNWAQFYHHRTIGNSSHTSLVRGFGLPDRRGLRHSRIVLLLTPHTPASVLRFSRVEPSDKISGSRQLGADLPQTISR